LGQRWPRDIGDVGSPSIQAAAQTDTPGEPMNHCNLSDPASERLAKLIEVGFHLVSFFLYFTCIAFL
jgi:hypothetical protein